MGHWSTGKTAKSIVKSITLMVKIIISVKFFLIIYLWIIFISPVFSLALEADEILILANRNAKDSIGLAQYYIKKRGIPEANLVKLWITDKELCSRDDFLKNVVAPVRRYIKGKYSFKSIHCIAVMYGLPLRVAPPEMTKEDEKRLEGLEKKKESLKKLINDLEGTGIDNLEGHNNELKIIKKEIAHTKKKDQGASFDSEIALVLEEAYPLSGWIPNFYFLGNRGKKIDNMAQNALMVARLDGPSPEIVRRIINDSIATETTGLKGTAYFDARWPEPIEGMENKTSVGYRIYDLSIHSAAERIRETGRMPITVNNKPELFQQGECPDAALYCGWYSLGKYIDAFNWSQGAVGYHIASSECASLKTSRPLWCKEMLKRGVVATLGPVAEPYVNAFPIPELFFGLLINGRWTLAECYALSQPFWSWQMVLIGDPLYRPFKIK